jgi:protein gp37
MAENTSIEWCDASWNPWHGCAKVSPGCDHCYAERLALRYGFRNIWGVDAERRTFGESHWNEPLRWDRGAKRQGVRRRVFCASMADVFDNHPAVIEPRARLWALIRATPNLDWLVLTKRIGNAPRMLPADWDAGYPNVWLGISVVNQEEADRDIPKLLRMSSQVRFLSCEPLLAPIDLYPFQKGCCLECGGGGELVACGPTTTFPEDDDGLVRCEACRGTGDDADNHGIDWCIVGGESGSQSRPMLEEWAGSLQRQCEATDVAFFFKQGSQANWPHFKDFESFPKDLQVRQWPRVDHAR